MRILDYVRRNGGHGVPTGARVKVYRVKLDRGGYDRRGNHFGVGNPCYVMDFYAEVALASGENDLDAWSVGIRWTSGYQALRKSLLEAGFRVDR